jgi:hypothetical protein
LQYTINNDIESQASLREFMKEISEVDIDARYPEEADHILREMNCHEEQTVEEEIKEEMKPE